MVSGMKHCPWSVALSSMIHKLWGAEISFGCYTPSASPLGHVSLQVPDPTTPAHMGPVSLSLTMACSLSALEMSCLLFWLDRITSSATWPRLW